MQLSFFKHVSHDLIFKELQKKLKESNISSLSTADGQALCYLWPAWICLWWVHGSGWSKLWCYLQFPDRGADSWWFLWPSWWVDLLLCVRIFTDLFNDVRIILGLFWYNEWFCHLWSINPFLWYHTAAKWSWNLWQYFFTHFVNFSYNCVWKFFW